MINKKEQSYIQVKELFTNQVCPKCEGYLAVKNLYTYEEKDGALDFKIVLHCLTCGTDHERELIT